MAVTVTGTNKGSPAEKLALPAGTKLHTVDGHEIRDVLDYGFFTTNRKLTLCVELPNGEKKTLKLEKKEYEDPGFTFDSFLMDEQHSCRNKCLFCFIDQLPGGMREPLYFKDDDERLSYLFGNYITLTNIEEHEIDRIIEMKISPVNISVHSCESELRCFIMSNRFAGDKLRFMEKLAKAGVEMNCQIVLCRGINDGEHLEKTVRWLADMYPAVQSIAAVPAGLTAHRNGLYPLEQYDAPSGKETLAMLEGLNAEFRKKLGVGLIYPADEWFLLAGRDVPGTEYYDEMRQLENGVGMLALFRDEFMSALEDAKGPENETFSDIITGEAAAGFIAELVRAASQRFPKLKATVHTVKNEFFGGNVSVAGLLTGRDVMAQVKPRDISGRLLFSETVLRREGDMMLDDVTPSELADYYRTQPLFIGAGDMFFDALCGR